MNTVPNMISTKDLAYLEDMFNWNLNASKKAYHFSTEAKDEEVKNLLLESANMHARICRSLTDILKEGESVNG